MTRGQFVSNHKLLLCIFIAVCLTVLFIYSNSKINIRISYGQDNDPAQYGPCSAEPAPGHRSSPPAVDINSINTNIKSGSRKLIVDDHNRLIFCPIPKIASRNWLRAMVRMQHCRNDSLDVEALVDRGIYVSGTLEMAGLKTLHDYSEEEQIFRINEYYKFMFSRHPFERLVSAYKDKFTHPVNDWTKPFHRGLGASIIKQYRDNPSAESLLLGDDVKFEEFVSYVIGETEANKGLNGHWSPMTGQCGPTHFPYDFIGSFDSFSDDVATVLSNLHDKSCTVEFATSGGATSNITYEMSLLTQQQKCSIRKIYAKDFENFSFDTDIVC